MNIYIRIELLARELQGRLLLALVAAERGHTVLLGRFNHDRLTGDGRKALPPGIFHDKSLGVAETKRALHRALVASGFVITAQDEEHGLAEDTFDPMAGRFDADAMSRTARLFAWGRFDGEAIRRLLPEHQARIIETGSPRVDFWRPELRSVARVGTTAPTDSPVILYAASGGEQLFDGMPSSWETLAGAGRDPHEGLEATRVVAESLVFTANARLAIESLALALPDVTVVVRPHPAGKPGAWETLLQGSPSNVRVVTDNRVSTWIERGAAVITNGSTVSFEVAVSGRPGISYTPEGFDYAPAANRVLRNASTVEDLVALVRCALDSPDQWNAGEAHDVAVEKELSSRFAALTGRLAADRMVDAWEEFAGSLPRSSENLHQSLRRGRVGRGTDFRRAWQGVAARTRRMAAAPVPSMPIDEERAFFRAKFPPIDLAEVDVIHRSLTETLGRFGDVRVQPVHDRLLHVARSS